MLESDKPRRLYNNGCGLLTLFLILAAVCYVFTNIAVANMRTQTLGPLCAKHGWVLIDYGLAQPAKCLDLATGLMYLPPEVYNKR